MNRSTTPADRESLEPKQAAGFGTQLIALATAACVGTALLMSNALLGVLLFVLVLGWMYGGDGWMRRMRRIAAGRDCRVLKRVLSPQ